MPRLPSLSVAATILAIGLVSCGGPTGPISPTTIDSPRTVVVIHPRLEGVVSVPAAPDPAQVYTWTSDAHLRYDFRLQNKTEQRFALRVRATFFDETGVVVDDQLPTVVYLNDYEIKSVTVVCGNADGKKVQVQVSPAN
jgi:hypothetical protein